MDNKKKYLIDLVWGKKSPQIFEEWLYKQNSEELEKLFGNEEYLRLISFDYRKTTSFQVNRLIKSCLNDELITEFSKEFDKRKKAITGICIKKNAPDYNRKEIRDWNVQVGKKYEFITVELESRIRVNKRIFVRYVDKDYHFYPSGLLPIELFDISLNSISDIYIKNKSLLGSFDIEPKEWAKKNYNPTIHSFWEDFYDGDEKAVETYYSVLDKLGIKDIW